MTDVYRDTAYRSDAIPVLLAGGHPDMDLAFQRLPWGGTHNPIMPNTIEVQLTYARLYENDAESGFPWDDTTYLIGNGFLRGLQGFLYILYMSVGVGLIASLAGLAIAIISLIIYHQNISDFIDLIDSVKYYFGILLGFYFGGKYGRILIAWISEKRQRANLTGLYRREGLVRIKKGKAVFEAPFIEFDAYLVHSPSGRGGRYFNLLLQHRYSKHQLWMKGLLTDAMDQKEVYAYWEMIQQFMDVSRPLPDVPIFEPFRHRDPVTAEWDQRTGRDPFKWRKISPESWRKHHEQTYRERLRATNFHQACILDAHIQGRGLPLPDHPRGAMLA
ncbi:hypothetical protein [Marinobacter shengliensis]|uniref:hypothetical protein n=1 Tax=Marinobacter shengliensis TaxID=1389223 RepID=UPI0035B8E5AB